MKTRKALRVQAAILDEIIRECRQASPREACGILAGKEGEVQRVYGIENVSEEPEKRYVMDAKLQFAVFREMRSDGLELVGIFHSHPATPAYPSKTDTELAFYPEAAYLIVSLVGKQPDVRAFAIEQDSFSEMELKE